MTRHAHTIARSVAVGLLAALGMVVWTIAIQPIIDRHQLYEERSADASLRLARHQAAARQLDTLKGTLTAISRRQERSGAFLTGATPAIAASRLQEYLADTVHATGGRVQSQDTLTDPQAPDSADPGTGEIAVRMNLSLDEAGLHQLLEAIETRLPVLFVRQLAVRNGGAAEAPHAGEVRLSVDLTVVGYRGATGE